MKYIEKQILINAELHKEDDGYYLHLEYIKDTMDKVYKITPDPIKLYLSDEFTIITKGNDYGYYSDPIMYSPRDICVKFGLGEIRVPKDFTIHSEVIEEKIHDMTKEEIEKKLGYKVNIVESK